MAEFGKGDPRWLVDDRPDGKNVNAWHWVERDCTKWFKNILTKEVKDLKLSDKGNCKVTSIEKLEGEMTYCNRKKKHMFFYEIELRLKWEATINNKKVTGQIRIPSICDEEPIDSMEMRITTTSKSKDGDNMRTILKSDALPVIRKLISKLIDETKEHFKEPIGDTNEQPLTSSSDTRNKGVLIEKTEIPTTSKNFKNITMKLLFQSSPDLMYQCLIDDQRLSYFTQSAAQMEKKEGGKFSLFGGQITGTNKLLKENEKIVQDWRFTTWQANHYSKVTINLQKVQGGTEVVLTQTGVPSSDFERTKNGWNEHFWKRIQNSFGFTYRTI